MIHKSNINNHDVHCAHTIITYNQHAHILLFVLLKVNYTVSVTINSSVYSIDGDLRIHNNRNIFHFHFFTFYHSAANLLQVHT